MKRTWHTRVGFMILILLLSLSVSGWTGYPASEPASSPAMAVQPILFVPNNLTADPSYAPSINAALETIRTWYGSQLGGKTFDYVPTQVVVGQHELSYYCPKTTNTSQCIQIPGELGADSGDIYNVLSELALRGYPIQQNNILLVFWVGGYGYAGGAQYSPSSGFAALGDWALDGLAGKYESGTATSRCSDSAFAYVICKKNAQIGSVGHELGHAFGLPHPTDDGSQPGDPNYWLSTIMAVSWDFPEVLLIDSPANPEKTVLRQHPFFQLFADIHSSYWAASYIERLYAAGITGGCGTSPLQYCPEASVTRAQMAVFLLRGIHGASYSPPAIGAGTGFTDVQSGHWAAAWIKQLAAEGITSGCGTGSYCPEQPVTRAQMAVFLLRSEHGASYTPPAVGGSTGFTDVPPGYWAAAFIKQLVTEGITSGCGSGVYCPEAPVTRAQMAVFLVRTFSLP